MHVSDFCSSYILFPAVLFMEHWKRRQMRLNYVWDLTGFGEEEEVSQSHISTSPFLFWVVVKNVLACIFTIQKWEYFSNFVWQLHLHCFTQISFNSQPKCFLNSTDELGATVFLCGGILDLSIGFIGSLFLNIAENAEAPKNPENLHFNKITWTKWKQNMCETYMSHNKCFLSPAWVQLVCVLVNGYWRLIPT